MSKTLKIWNGRWASNCHVYVAAYSMADARRLFFELGLRDPGATEIRKYWSPDCWGIDMEGITPERGVWIQTNRSNRPVRRMPYTVGGVSQ